ncbi:MAG: serine/threonine-protein phosphatase [Planctomycetes bacterium]|nr:serine/threonine-protein phosphatase [Planctomycetota bacterium]
MDDRQKPPRSGPKPAGIGIRGSSPLSQVVRERLTGDPSWGFFAQNGKWICPFCLSAVVKRQGRTREDSLAVHLEGCRSYSAGRGQPQDQNVVSERMHFENMTFQAENNPAWRVYDHEAVWFCPSCLDRILAVRLQGGQLNNFVFQAMAGHLRVCPSYRQGIIYSAEDIQRARDLSSRAPGLSQVVAQQLQFSVWRYTDANGQWVCPCCLGHTPEIVISSPNDWHFAIDPISKHLLLRCPAFTPERLETQPESLVQQSAGGGAPGTIAAKPSTHTPTGVTKIMPGANPPSLPQRQGMRTPPVARPASGAHDSVTGNQRPVGEAPGQSNYRKHRSVVMPPAAPTAAPPAGPLFGNPKGDVLAGTSLDKVSSDRVKPSDVGQGSTWMDEADAEAPDSAKEPTPHSRTDVIHARNLQATMLAQSPELPGFKFATRYEACSDITGDFYEFITLSDGRIGFALGDVSGHGVQAGLIMSMAKKTLEIYASIGAGPAETLAKVNDALTRDLGGKMFISMIYGILSPYDQSITWARAGGTPAMRYNAKSDTLVEVKPKGMVLGMKAGQVFRQSLEEETTQLNAGDVFLLYTDGVTETMNAQQEEYGTDRLGDVLKKHSPEGPESLLGHVMDHIRRFRGTLPVSDDITILALTVE